MSDLLTDTGFRIWPTKHLEPRLQRDTFSGGTNLSARERNLALIRESAAKVYVMKGERKIIGSRFALARVALELGGFGPRLTGRLHPAAREWYRLLVTKKPEP